MRTLVFDYFRRYWWTLLASFLLHIAALGFSWLTPELTVLFFVFGGSAFILFADVSRHGARMTRTLLSLPLTAKEISAAWRFVGLVFPIFYFLVALLLSVFVVQMVAETPHLTFQRVVIVTVFQTLLLGVTYFALTGMPIGNSFGRTATDHMWGSFYGLIWGITIPGSILLMNTLPTTFAGLHPAHIAAAGFMLAATVAGWFRAGSLVRVQRDIPEESIRRQQRREIEKRRMLGRGAKADMVKFGGASYFMARIGGIIGILGLAILLLDWFVMSFFISGEKQAEGGGEQSLSVMDIQLHFVMPVLGLVMGMVVISQLRVLRSLPISRVRLTNLLVLWPLFFNCAFSAVASSLYWLLFAGRVGDMDFWLSATGGIIALAGVPMIIRCGVSSRTIFVLFMIIPILMLVRSVSHSFDISSGTLLTVAFSAAGVSLAAIWYFTYQAIASSHPWRAGALKLLAQARGTA